MQSIQPSCFGTAESHTRKCKGNCFVTKDDEDHPHTKRKFKK